MDNDATPETTAHQQLSAADKYFTPADVAERLAVSRSMVYALLKRKALAATFIGRLPRIIHRRAREDHLGTTRGIDRGPICLAEAGKCADASTTYLPWS
jgi:excisionase family DNA binding protein